MEARSDQPDDMEPRALEALLRWYVDMGVDAAIGEAPTIAAISAAPPAKPVPQASVPLQAFNPGEGTATNEKLIAEANQAALTAETLEELARRWASVPGCNLAKTAAAMIFSAGQAGAPLMFMGAAPDTDDERAGEALAGVKGDLFDAMLKAIGLERETIYYGNVLPWRPPGNRQPTPLELSLCLPFARRQIELARPRLLVCLGERPAQQLFGSSDPISKLRGRWLSLEGNVSTHRTLVTFALDFLLKQPLQKRRAWADMMLIASDLST